MSEDTSPSDAVIQQLILSAKEGDTEAFSKLYDHFVDSVYRFAAFRLQQEIAEDVTAEIFLKVWEKLHTYKPQCNVPFRAWLFRIARHSVIDAYRTQKEIVDLPEDMDDPDQLNRADTDVRKKDLIRIVRQALQQLPKRYGSILELAYMAELPNDEISRVLKLSHGTVRVLKFRALKKLETLLPPDIQEHLSLSS